MRPGSPGPAPKRPTARRTRPPAPSHLTRLPRRHGRHRRSRTTCRCADADRVLADPRPCVCTRDADGGRGLRARRVPDQRGHQSCVRIARAWAPISRAIRPGPRELPPPRERPVVVTSKMTRISRFDRTARLRNPAHPDLSVALAPIGLRPIHRASRSPRSAARQHDAMDRTAQPTAYQRPHAADVVLPDGTETRVGSRASRRLRPAARAGSEGTLGTVARVRAHLPNHQPSARCCSTSPPWKPARRR
jgi:hypothetical protein